MDDLPPDWLTPLPDAATMRAIDRWAIEERGVAGLDLMERAGAGVTRAVERVASDGPVTVVCGKGNNGGDGLVVARLLRDAGREVTIVCVAPPEDFAGDARTNLDLFDGVKPSGEFVPIRNGPFRGLGDGHRRRPQRFQREVIKGQLPR